MGIVYSVGAALYVFLEFVYPAEAGDRGNWRYVKSLLLLGLVTSSMTNLIRIQRRVYSGAADVAERTATTTPSTQLTPSRVSSPSEPDDRDSEACCSPMAETIQGADGCFGLVSLALVILLVPSIVLILPVAVIVRTLSAHDTSIVTTDASLGNISFLLGALAATVGLIAWLAVGHNPDDRISLDAAFLASAVIANIYLGFALWLIAVRLFGIEPAVSHPREFGLMVWWNLTRSVH